jgi:hypothetical protein
MNRARIAPPEIRAVADLLRVDTSARRSRLIREHQSLDGGDVLPGFSVRLADLFERLWSG